MSDFKRRIESLPAEKRRLLEEMLAKRVSGDAGRKPMPPSEPLPLQPPEAHYDVAILGGGLAGLSLARQLKRARPGVRILVAEKRRHPVPEAAFKVGESTVEAGAYYLRDVLGLEEHLRLDHLPKAGTRFFFTAGDNSDITRRVELGGSFLPPIRSYQIDRGRLENRMRLDAVEAGVDFRDECRVTQIHLGADEHTIALQRPGQTMTVSTRWVIDASGRAGLLKRKLGLTRSVNHHANAIWFRLNDPMDLDDWSQDQQWRARVGRGLRRLSTNHLMGRGYWVWLIPLASGSISIGIVADAALHPFAEMNRFDRALAWLAEHEPQCARAVAEKQHLLQDFQALRQYAHGCEQVISADRWGITGEAGVFADPFYSPGTDFIGIGNIYLCDLIDRDMAGEAIAARAGNYNRIYPNSFETLMTGYERQYPLMGNAQVMTAKVVWDFLAYWALTAILMFHNKFCDLEFMASIGQDLQRANHLNARMQALFRDWDRLTEGDGEGFFIDLLSVGFLHDQHCHLTSGLSDAALRERIASNITLIETVVAEVFRKALTQTRLAEGDRQINPYGVSLDPEAWATDEVFGADRTEAPPASVTASLGRIWFEHLVSDLHEGEPEPMAPHGPPAALTSEKAREF